MSHFKSTGWEIFAPEPAMLDWVAHAKTDALRALQDPDLSKWYECEDTWFVGLDALANDAAGRVAGSAALTGAAVDFISKTCGGWPDLHRGQVSGVFSGYPRPRQGESDAGFRYRLNRCAAHVDGVLGVGQPKRRLVQEPHAFILGIVLTQAEAAAAPLVVWQGSHRIMQSAFQKAFDAAQGGELAAVDVTEIYQSARRAVFETCPRVVLHGPPGTAFVVHRLALHGVAPWETGAQSDPEGRLIAYFRPPMTGGARAWADAP